MTKMQIAIH